MSGLSRGSTSDIFLYLPAGVILPFGGDTPPGGWAICDGSIVNRSEYPDLFSAIGTNWGQGDGATTFHLPDLRGRFMRGRDQGTGRDPLAGSRTAANTGGATGDSTGSVQFNYSGSTVSSQGSGDNRPINANVSYIIKL